MDNENNRVFTKFQRHVNNAAETVSADHIGAVQAALTQAETGISKLRDTQFRERVLDILDNNYYANAMFVNEVNDQSYLDLTLSRNVSFEDEDGSIQLNRGVGTGVVCSTIVQSSLGDGIRLQDFFLVVDHNIPAGSDIRYFLVDREGAKYPLTANETKLPMHVYAEVTGYRIQAEMRTNAVGESPQIFGMAVLFFDEGVEGEYGLTNPDLQRFSQFGIGMTVLIRDRAQDDKLVRIEEGKRITHLEYSPDGLLMKVITRYEDDDITSTETLNYGEYLNSKNVNEWVLLSIASDSNTVDGPGAAGNYDWKF